MPPLTATQMVTALSRASARLVDASLTTKVARLRQAHSNDSLQDLQSQVIVELYDAVRQIQEAIWPMLAIIPDVSGARDAAASAAAAAGASTTHAKATPARRVR